MSSGDFVTQALTVVSSTPSTQTNTTQASLITAGFSGAAFTVSGTFVGTVSFYATADGGANWNPINVAPSNSTTPVTSTTVPGLFRANVSGYTHVSAQLSALTSGTPTVSIHCSSESASALSGGATGGGGGGPGITLTTVGTTGPSTFNTGTGALNVPNYADISKLVLHTTGTSGAATLASGTLNVPIYAPGTINQVQLTTPSSITTTSNMVVSTGVGVAFQAVYNTITFITYSYLISNSATTVALSIYIYRTTGSIPALNTPPGGADVQIATSRGYTAPAANGVSSMTGGIYDNGFTVGTPYNYYLVFQTNSGTLTLASGSVLQVTEMK